MQRLQTYCNGLIYSCHGCPLSECEGVHTFRASRKGTGDRKGALAPLSRVPSQPGRNNTSTVKMIVSSRDTCNGSAFGRMVTNRAAVGGHTLPVARRRRHWPGHLAAQRLPLAAFFAASLAACFPLALIHEPMSKRSAEVWRIHSPVDGGNQSEA